MVKSLTFYLDETGTIHAVQSSYRRHHSTETATIIVVLYILMATDAQDVSELALVDLTAAFDTFDHSILLQRLHTSHHVGGIALDRLSNYLRSITQSVRFGGITAPACPVPRGVHVVCRKTQLFDFLFILYTSVISHDSDFRCQC